MKTSKKARQECSINEHKIQCYGIERWLAPVGKIVLEDYSAIVQKMQVLRTEKLRVKVSAELRRYLLVIVILIID